MKIEKASNKSIINGFVKVNYSWRYKGYYESLTNFFIEELFTQQIMLDFPTLAQSAALNRKLGFKNPSYVKFVYKHMSFRYLSQKVSTAEIFEVPNVWVI